MEKEYLGDGVYAAVDDYANLVLTTEDGLRATNTIVLYGPTLTALLEWLKRMGIAFTLLLLTTACAYVPMPTEPSLAATTEARQPTQMIVRVVGPSGWYPDRIYVDAFTLDQKGAKLDGVVRCDPSQGHLEPAQWDTTSRSGTLWIGTAPGATFACRSLAAPEVEAFYRTTQLDFEMPRGCCGGSPKPPVVPKPPVTPPSEEDQ